jgi:hypothetical protein
MHDVTNDYSFHVIAAQRWLCERFTRFKSTVSVRVVRGVWCVVRGACFVPLVQP